jgi:hypothetical protein
VLVPQTGRGPEHCPGPVDLERELQRLAINAVTLPELLDELHLPRRRAVSGAGEGELTAAQVSGAVQRRTRPQERPAPFYASRDQQTS